MNIYICDIKKIVGIKIIEDIAKKMIENNKLG